MTRLREEICRIAKAEIGVEEIDGTNTGERVNEYKAATNLPSKASWPWCSAFVCWVVREAMKAAKVKETKTFKRPTTAGAWDFERWSLAQDESTNTKKPAGTDIQAGDIVVFTFSHIGIALTAPDKGGNVVTVEGNSNPGGSREGGGVFKLVRSCSRIRSRIRFTV